MTTSINTNVSAYYAQQNLRSAGVKAEVTIARLSSGNRIVRASDDVAALSIGTILKSNISTLKTALTNTQQANSLLQVADGGLKNIGDILQRQKSLAVQANSGTLSGSERSFLNQEFQNLKDEIDRLVANTKFNAVTLLDGSLSKATGINFNTTKIAATTLATSGSNLTLNANLANGDYIEVNGSKVFFTTSTYGSADAKGKVLVGGNATETTANLASFLNSTNDARINVARYTATGAVLAAFTATGDLAANNTFSFGAGTANVTANNTNGLTGDGVDGLARYRTFAVGDIVGNRLRGFGNFTDSANQSAGIDTANVTDNADFLGKINNFEVAYTNSANNVVVSVRVGSITYSSGVLDLNNATQVARVTLTGSNGTGAEGGNISLGFSGVVTTVNSQGDADTLAGEINASLSNVTFVQSRDVTSFTNNSYVYTDGVRTGTLIGATVDFRSSSFENFEIEDIKVTAPQFGSTDAVIEAVINGETYRSYAGLGSQLEDNSLIILGNINDSSKTLSISLGNDTINGGYAVKLDTSDEAASFQAALQSAFGITDGKSKISFQTGSKSNDEIGIELKNADTASLYDNKDLNVLTVNDAIEAGEQIDEAIATVTALRANVGALQSRFNYASANLESSIQNQDAAKSVFLDANISDESSQFASAQVLLQASISVLAQANLLPQNLLKLIG